MNITKLSKVSTFKQWREKINELIDSILSVDSNKADKAHSSNTQDYRNWHKPCLWSCEIIR